SPAPPAGGARGEGPRLGRGRRRAATLAGSLLVGGAYSERLYRSAALSRRVADAVRSEPSAWLAAHSSDAAPAALARGRPVWIDFHNLDSEIWRRVAETARSAGERLFARIQAPRGAELEGPPRRRASP